MARRYHVTPLPPPGRHRLPAEVAHHLGRVMRVRPGDRVVLFDGAGCECGAEISHVQPPVVEAVVGEPATSTREPGVQVELAVALPKGHRADWLFEHATEVGARRFRPLRCARSNPLSRTDKQPARWHRIVAAAAGQCDRGWLPAIDPWVDLPGLLAQPDLPDERYLAAAAGPPLQAATGARAVVLVGPEGGLTADEESQAEAAGFLPRSLGPLTLRTETAALAATVRLLCGERSRENV